jgi:hypothetical protein
VDALSCRHEEDTVVHALSVPNFILLDEFRVEAEHLLGIVAKHAQIDIRTTGLEWALVDGLVVRRSRLFILATATAWPQVPEHAHGIGHEGVQKTLQRLCASFTLDGNRLVRDFVRSCSVCQRNKTEHLHSAGLL